MSKSDKASKSGSAAAGASPAASCTASTAELSTSELRLALTINFNSSEGRALKARFGVATADEARSMAKQMLTEREKHDYGCLSSCFGCISDSSSSSKSKKSQKASQPAGKSETSTSSTAPAISADSIYPTVLSSPSSSSSQVLSPTATNKSAKATRKAATPASARRQSDEFATLLEIVRDDGANTRLRRLRPDRSTCGYTLRPLPANAPVAGASNRNIEAEHVIECQMLARTIYSNQHPEMRLLLQNMTIREPLKRQPQLIENAFRAIYSVHNEVGNLLWTTYDVNMWKKQCVQTMLEELDCNAHCERSFANSLHDQIVRLHSDVDERTVSQIADGVARKMKEVADQSYIPHLHDIVPDAAAERRQQRKEMYQQLAEECNLLVDQMQL